MEEEGPDGAHKHRSHQALHLEEPDKGLEGCVGEEGRDQVLGELPCTVGDRGVLSCEDEESLDVKPKKGQREAAEVETEHGGSRLGPEYVELLSSIRLATQCFQGTCHSKLQFFHGKLEEFETYVQAHWVRFNLGA